MKCLYINNEEYKFKDEADFESFIKNLPPNFVQELREALSVDSTKINKNQANSFDTFYKSKYENSDEDLKVEIYKGFWTRDEVAKQTDKVFLFGDNTNDKVNTKYVPSTTQAVIRGLPNAIGIDTKKDRSTNEVKGINIKSDKTSPNSLGNRLTNPNWYAKDLFDVESNYKANASKVKAPHLNAEEALKYDMNLMYQLQLKKFRQNPELIDEINAKGGLEFIKQSSHIVGVKNSRWEGKGMESNFIKVLAKSYETVAKELGKFVENNSSYFTDADFPQFKQQVDEAIQKAKNSGKIIVIPEDGIGTGKAELATRAPKLFAYLQQELDKLKNQSQQTSNQSGEIYNQLGNKTQSENIVLPNDLAITYTSSPNNFWTEIEPAFRKKYPKGLVAFRGNQSNFNIGNPFDWQKHGVGKATEMFIDWITTGNNYNEVAATDSLRKDYIEKIKRSKGEKILYYAETGRPTHATALDYLINNPNSPFNQTQQTSNRSKVKFNSKFDGKSISFKRISPEIGTEADVAMRQVADSVIVELAESNINKRKVTSSETSLRDIRLKMNPKTGGFGLLRDITGNITAIPNGHVLSYQSDTPKVVMLARNNELNNTNKELGDLTKQQIDTIVKQGVKFVVGNSYIDKSFIDYLIQKGYEFEIYGMSGKDRITPDNIQPQQTESKVEVRTNDNLKNIDINSIKEGMFFNVNNTSYKVDKIIPYYDGKGIDRVILINTYTGDSFGVNRQNLEKILKLEPQQIQNFNESLNKPELNEYFDAVLERDEAILAYNNSSEEKLSQELSRIKNLKEFTDYMFSAKHDVIVGRPEDLIRFLRTYKNIIPDQSKKVSELERLQEETEKYKKEYNLNKFYQKANDLYFEITGIKAGVDSNQDMIEFLKPENTFLIANYMGGDPLTDLEIAENIERLKLRKRRLDQNKKSKNNKIESQDERIQDLIDADLESLEPTVSSNVINSSTINPNVQEAFSKLTSKLKLDSDTISKLKDRINNIEFNDSYESYDDFLKNNEGVDFNDAPFYKTAGGNSSVKGMFWNNTIYLFDKRSKELVVEHELVHSILKIASAENDENYQIFERVMLNNITEFLNIKTVPTEIDGFLNQILLFPDKTKIDELITRILTDKRFSDAFKSVKTTEVKKKETFWQKVVNAFKTLLGVEDGTYFDKILEPVVLYIDSLDYDTKSDPVYLSEETIEEDLEDGYSKFNSAGKKIYKEFQSRVLKNDKKFFDNNYFERIDKFDSKGNITHDYEYNLSNLEEGDLILAPVMVKSNDKWMYVTESGQLTEKVEDNKNYKTKWFPALYGNSPTYPTVAIGTEKGGSKIIKNKILGIRKLDKSGSEVNLLESSITIKKFREKAVAFRQAFLEGKSLPDVYKYSGYDRVTLKTDGSYEVDDFEVGDIVTVKFKEGKSFYALVEKNQGSGLLVSSKNKTFFVKPKDIAGVHKSKEGLLEDVEKVAGKLSDNKNYTVKSVTGSMTEEEYFTYRKKKNPDYVFKPEDFKTYKEKQTNIETLSKGDAVLVKWEKGFAWKSVLFSDGERVVALDGKYPKVYKASQIEKIAYNNKETNKSFTEQEEILKKTEGYKWNKDYYVVSAKRDKSELNRQFNLKRIHKLKPGDFITYNKSFMVGVKKVEYSSSKIVHNITPNGLIEVPFEYKDKNGNTKYGIDRVKVDQIEKFIFNKENHTEIKDDIAKTYEQYKSRYFSKKVFKHKENKSWEIGNTKYFTVPATPELFLNQKYKDSDINKYTIKDNIVYEVTSESEILATPVYEFGKDAPYIRMKEFGGKQYIVSGEERSFNIQYLKDKSGNLKPDSIEKIMNLKRGEMINYQYTKDGQKYYYKTAVYNVGIKKEKVGNNWIEVPYVQAIVESGDNILINDIALKDIVSIGKIFVPPLTGSKPVAYSDLGDEFLDEELPNKDIILKKGLILESKTANIKFYTELVNNIIENNPDLKIEFENKEFFKDDQSYSIQDNTLFLNSDLISTSNRIGDLAPIWLYKASQEQPDVYSQLLETFETNPYIKYYKEKENPLEYYISNKLSGRIENDFENKWAKENQEFFDLINSLSLEFTSNYLDKKYQTKYSEVKDSKQSLKEGLIWIKQIMPNANVELVQELIDGIGRGSYNTVTDLITLSEKYADKRTAKHEVFHAVFNRLSKEKQEELLNEGSQLFGIPRGESKTTTKYSQDKIDYILKSIDILQSDKAKTLFKTLEKNKVTGDNFWKKIQELGIPKEQIELLKQYNTTNREELITNMLADYSFVVESNIAYDQKDVKEGRGEFSQINAFTNNGFRYIASGLMYAKYPENNEDDVQEITKREFNEQKELFINQQKGSPTAYYSNLTVPGGTNYTENEIATPLITPSIKGHAQFATDNGIGWFRSDERNNQVRRILEVQSDLFQKGRDRKDLVTQVQIKSASNPSGLANMDETFDKWKFSMMEFEGKTESEANEIINKEKERILSNYQLNENSNDNQFLQLLNKDSNWITFFIKSIIQNSAKKRYEKVLFPSGNTASKIEGHTTLEEFKKQKEDRIKQIEKEDDEQIKRNREGVHKNTYIYNGIAYNNILELAWDENNEDINKEYNFDLYTKAKENGEQLGLSKKDKKDSENEINQLKQELERVETEGFGALKPIWNFYENTVTNILNKQFGKENVKQITDEYGNTWNELDLSSSKVKEQTENIRFQSPKLQYTGDLAIEEKIAEMMENTPDEKLPQTILGKWIQSVRNFFRNIFKEKSMIQQLLRNINQGNIDLNSQRLDYTLLQEGKTKFKKIIENTLSTEVYKTKNPELINSGLIDQICNV